MSLELFEWRLAGDLPPDTEVAVPTGKLFKRSVDCERAVRKNKIKPVADKPMKFELLSHHWKPFSIRQDISQSVIPFFANTVEEREEAGK